MIYVAMTTTRGRLRSGQWTGLQLYGKEKKEVRRYGECREADHRGDRRFPFASLQIRRGHRRCPSAASVCPRTKPTAVCEGGLLRRGCAMAWCARRGRLNQFIQHLSGERLVTGGQQVVGGAAHGRAHYDGLHSLGPPLLRYRYTGGERVQPRVQKMREKKKRGNSVAVSR